MDYMPLLRPFTTEQLVRARTYFDDIERLGRGSRAAADMYISGRCFMERLLGSRQAYDSCGYDRPELICAASPTPHTRSQFEILRRDLDLVLAERGISDGGKEVSPKEREYAETTSL